MATSQRGEPPSFSGKAAATIVIYFFGWLPGLIVNAIFHNEAKEASRRWGQSLPGAGCLSAMLWIQMVFACILVVVLLLGVVSLL